MIDSMPIIESDDVIADRHRAVRKSKLGGRIAIITDPTAHSAT